MKIISKIEIHLLFYLLALICILTGLLKDFVIISFIILFHEVGHILVSQIWKWEIDRIIVLPFGGITIFKEMINRPIKEELFIALAGPFFQSILFFIFSSSKWSSYNLALLCFNLIPIIPLDGSKIVNLCLNRFFPFKKSHIFSIVISIILICIMIFYFGIERNLMMLIVISFLCFKVLKEIKEHPYLFYKFLWERYSYYIYFKKKKILKSDSLKDMKRDYSHLFYRKNHYYTEKEMLREKFDNHRFL